MAASLVAPWANMLDIASPDAPLVMYMLAISAAVVGSDCKASPIILTGDRYAALSVSLVRYSSVLYFCLTCSGAFSMICSAYLA